MTYQSSVLFFRYH